VEHIDKKLINWASILEEQTRQQAQRTASMPFIWPHLALMPDAHQGKGATVGSVIPTLGAIMPAAVGVDIGCGMIAVRTERVPVVVHGARRRGGGDHPVPPQLHRADER
jgi:tRNA-splicing ligase RtcB